MKSPLVSGGRCWPPPPPAPSCGGQGSPCLFTAGGERADIVWTGAGRGGCGRKNGRRQPSRSSRGGKSQVLENQKGFPQTVPISHTLFFFLLGGSTRSHLQQRHSKTHEVTAPSRVPSMLHPRRWDLIGVEKCRLPPTSSGGADFSGLLLFSRPTAAKKKK